MNTPTFSFEEGIEDVLQQIRTAERKPYITSLHGYPNTGKSRFARHCRDVLYQQDGLVGVTTMTDNQNHQFVRQYGQDFVFLEDMPGVYGAQRYALALFGKRPDQSLLFLWTLSFTPATHLDLIAQPYDGIIVNPKAQVKRYL